MNLYRIYVRTETNALYLQGIEHLKQRGFTILAIVCDGRMGLFQLFLSMPRQMCGFHQVAIIRRYLTKKAKDAGRQRVMAVDLDAGSYR